MKQNSIVKQNPKRAAARTKTPSGKITIGMDLGDKTSRVCVLNQDGEVQSESSVATSKPAMTQEFARLKRCRIAIEVGTHSPWVSRLIKQFGHEVIVANNGSSDGVG